MVKTVQMRTEDLRILRAKIERANPTARVSEDVQGASIDIRCPHAGHAPILSAYEAAPDQWLVAGSAVA